MKVVDASAMIETLTRTDKARSLRVLLDDDLAAPELLVVEVVHHFMRLVLGNRMTDTSAASTVRAFRDSDVDYVAVWPLMDRIWELRHNLSADDACYVALAEDLRCPLITTDKRLSRTPNLQIQIISL